MARPAGVVSVLPHGAALHGQRLLIVGGHAGVETARNIFGRFR